MGLVMAEMKAGYKQTDIGVIPEDWDVSPIKKIAPLQRGFDLPKSQIRSGVIPVAYSNGVMAYHNQAMVKGPGVYTGRSGTIGRVNYIDSDYWPHNTSLWVTNFFGNSPKYIYYLYNHIDFSRFSSGSGVPTLNRNDAHDYLCALPKPEEQKQIATVLSDVDGLIESLSQLIAKKRDMKTAAMQQLLTGKKRLPGFDGEWNKRTLGELGDCIIGLTYSPSQIDESGTLVLRSSNIQNEVLRFDDNVRVVANIPEKLMVRQNDILVCVRNGSRALIGKCALINQSAIGMTFGAFMSVYRSEFGSFIFYQFQSDVIQEQINKNLGATINQITNKTMRLFEIDFPEDENERNAIVSILSDMDSEIDALEQRLDKARSLKTGMMQELLTGKTRLNTAKTEGVAA